jgi:hypothetical protein
MLQKPSEYISRENGFMQFNKMYKQRMFTQMYLLVQASGNSQQMMQLCSLVSLQMLESQNKLEELMPIAQQALKVQGEAVDGEIQLTALSLFHKILI